MKNVILLLMFVIGLASCSIEKRRYMDGYHIQRHSANTEKSNDGGSAPFSNNRFAIFPWYSFVSLPIEASICNGVHSLSSFVGSVTSAPYEIINLAICRSDSFNKRPFFNRK